MVGCALLTALNVGGVPIDTNWALDELRAFERMTVMTNASSSSGGVTRITASSRTAVPDGEVIAVAPVIERILDRVIPDWRTSAPLRPTNRWTRHREAAQRAITLLQREIELREKLGDDTPALSAASFHPWAWEGARSMWASGHYRQAVVNALLKVQAETQNKTGRHDLSETRLFTEAFAPSAPRPGSSRLRLRGDDGSDTYKSAQRGAMNLAEGLFAGIRNVAVHTVAETKEDEQEALEQLAAVSVLARWVDVAQLTT